MTVLKRVFYIEDSPLFEGFTEGETWNGWQCPSFTLDIAKNVISMWADDDETSAYYDERLDMFLVVGSISTEPEVEIYASKTIEYQGESIKVYSIGSQSLCWDVAKIHS